MSFKALIVDDYDPFWFVIVVGSGITSTILHSFPYEAMWLRVISYLTFAIGLSAFAILMLLLVANMIHCIRHKSVSFCFSKYLKDSRNNVYWGFLPMGLGTIINYLHQFCENELVHTLAAERLMIFIYLLWWICVFLALGSTLGITLLNWNRVRKTNPEKSESQSSGKLCEELQTVFLLPVIPSVVVSSCSGTFNMSELFSKTVNLNVQYVTMVITGLIWACAMQLVFFIMGAYIWRLYVNKAPKGYKAFTLFLLVGPLGQGSYGILLLTDNIKTYIQRSFPKAFEVNTSTGSDALIIAYSFKVFGVIAALCLMSAGFFFTVVAVATVFSQRGQADPSEPRSRIYIFHKSWWAMPFPLGTMALASTKLYTSYATVAPIGAFRVVGAIYGILCTLATIICLVGCTYKYAYEPLLGSYRKAHRPQQAHISNEVDFIC